MLLVRRFEEQTIELSLNARVPGLLHSYIGQEAIAVGVCAALRDDDLIVSTHRGLGHFLAKGLDPGTIMAEIGGKATGYCKGKGGSMHVADPKNGLLSAIPVMGAMMPIAAGAALVQKLNGKDRVVVCFFGEGSATEGDFTEALNISALWDLPVLFVCENNRFALSMRVESSLASESVAALARPYGMPADEIDGNDVDTVLAATLEAVARARGGEGPSLLECLTYRVKGHNVGDAEAYRTRDEVVAWAPMDPLAVARERYLAAGLLTDELEAQMETEIQEIVEAAVRFMDDSPEPEDAVALEDVYAS
jgi:pyruvate dehydrogenase E1 component alpha subunit